MDQTKIDIRTLRVGDVIIVPRKLPFSTERRVYRGVENKDVSGNDHPYVITLGFSRIFAFEIEDVIPFDVDGRPLPHYYTRHYTLGDPLFGTDQTLWKYKQED